jgi:acyl-CoA synthetase (AMP-forming)/AMP-acid ligase II
MRETTIGERFVGQVLRTPENLAVRIDSRSVTYGELGTMAARIAGALGRNESGRPVAILMSEGPLLMRRLFAAAMRSRPFTPLEANMPEARLAAVIAASGVADILTDLHAFARCRANWKPGRPKSFNVETVNSAAPFAGSVPVSPDTAAAIIYNLGLYRRPKGSR